MADSQRETPPSSRQSRGTDSNEREAPPRGDRRRSRSPHRERRNDKPRRKDAGFKWKDKRREEDGRQDRESGLQRGYRDHYRPRSRSRSPRRRSPRREDHDSERQKKSEDRLERQEKKEKKEKKPAPTNQQPMIIITVNDRLGTKKAIPCFATDSISTCTSADAFVTPTNLRLEDFKIIVASMIGRQPHEILLKRQGERPFKDQLTLQDYGVNNNVQLDLEVDTGD